jgi:WD40 repeat protein
MENNNFIIQPEHFEFIGVATARYWNVIKLDDKHIMFACNNTLKLYSFDTRAPIPVGEDEKLPEEIFDGRLEFSQRVTTASLMVFVQSDSNWVGLTNDGEVIVWGKQTAEELKTSQKLQEIQRIETGMKYVRHAAVSKDGNTIAFVAEEIEDNEILVLKLEGGKLSIVQNIKDIPNSKIRNWEFDDNGHLYIVSELYEVENDGEKVRKKKNKGHTVCKYEVIDEIYSLLEKELLEDPSFCNHIKTTETKKTAYLVFQSKNVYSIDFSTFQITKNVVPESIQSLEFDCLLPDESYIVGSHSLLAHLSVSTSPTLITTDFTLPNPIYHSVWMNEGVVVMLAESGITAIKYKKEEEGQLEWKKEEEFDGNVAHLAGWGVDLNCNSTMMCFGDLSGRFHIYLREINEETKKYEFKREKPFKFQHGVRAIAFHPSNPNVVMAGLLSGWVFYIDPITDIVADIGKVEGNVTCMKWFQNYDGEQNVEYILAASSSSGDIKFFIQDKENPTQFKEFIDLHAHPKSDEPQDEAFGSLTNYSEIWSFVMQNYQIGSRMLKYFVTCSEDQTWKIWKILEEKDDKELSKCECLDILQGHTKAVTDLAWHRMNPSVLGEGYESYHVFASCSDDQTVRLYTVDISSEDPKFEYFKSLTTSFIQEWHTITYMALEENGHRVAVVTQNGYLVIWDIAGSKEENYEQKVIFARKVHTGSIEGLKWKNGKLLTISSDCSASMISYPKAEESQPIDLSSKAFALIKPH